MTTQDIANRLVELCRQGNFEAALKDLFSQDAVSIEAHATPDFDKETKGMDAMLAKGEKWNSMVQEVHSIAVSDPLVASNSFACTLRMNITLKEGGNMDMNELCVYQVKDEKVISEQFFM